MKKRRMILTMTMVLTVLVMLLGAAGAVQAAYQDTTMSKVSGALVAEDGLTGAAQNGKLYMVSVENGSMATGLVMNGTVLVGSSGKTMLRGLWLDLNATDPNHPSLANFEVTIYEIASAATFLNVYNGTTVTAQSMDREYTPTALATVKFGLNGNNATDSGTSDGETVFNQEFYASGLNKVDLPMRLKQGYYYLVTLANNAANAVKAKLRLLISEN